MSTGEKFVQMFIAIVLFFGVVARDPAADLAAPVAQRRALQSAAFVLPAVAADRARPALPRDQHDLRLVQGQRLGNEFVGLDNYQTVFTDDQQLKVLRNTAVWVVARAHRSPPSSASSTPC